MCPTPFNQQKSDFANPPPQQLLLFVNNPQFPIVEKLKAKKD